jgi:hypothetical protein
MNLEDFIKLYTGIVCDFDGSFGTQCMDLMHFYKYICLGIHDKTTLSAPTALSAWSLNYPTLFQKIKNTPTNFPVKGDIVFWGSTVGSAGHVAIVVSANVNSFVSFDANWPTGSLPHLQNHDYRGVLGWMHPSVSASTTPTMPSNWQTKIDSAKSLATLIKQQSDKIISELSI